MLKGLYDEIITAIDLIAIEKSCIFDSSRTANQDELAEVVHWLEKVLFGKNSVYGKRRILFQIGSPIALKNYAEQFNLDEETTTVQVNKCIKLEILSMLRQLADLRTESQRNYTPPILV
jgi:hypothetical protein